MSRFWKNKNVLITGGTGFVGSYVVEQLVERGANVSVTSRSGNTENIKSIKKEVRIVKGNLIDPHISEKATKKIDIVLHLAAKVSGIEYNRLHPATMFYENVCIAQNVFNASIKNNVERILVTSSACVYPRNASIPTKENEGFLDDPEPTNLGYGWSKRTLELLGRFYSEEFGIKVGIGRPYNTYGPRDNFEKDTSHVIPAMIERVYKSKSDFIVWGTGKQTRSFIYVEDVARGLIEVIEKYPKCEPLNIGSDEEITIEELAKLILKISGKDLKIKFDTSKPDGQPRRNCDISYAKEKIKFKSNTALEEGVYRTIKWYEQRL